MADQRRNPSRDGGQGYLHLWLWQTSGVKPGMWVSEPSEKLSPSMSWSQHRNTSRRAPPFDHAPFHYNPSHFGTLANLPALCACPIVKDAGEEELNPWVKQLASCGRNQSQSRASKGLERARAMIKTAQAELKNWLHFSICACHPCAGAMLIFSVSFQF